MSGELFRARLFSAPETPAGVLPLSHGPRSKSAKAPFCPSGPAKANFDLTSTFNALKILQSP